MPFAIYRSTEVKVQYFNGCGYVVRHDMYPHTTLQPDGVSIAAQVTRQGHAYLVGARQGLTDTAGFSITRYFRPDTDPFYVP